MGAREDERRWYGLTSQEEVARRTAEAQATERAQQRAEQLLGTDEQLNYQGSPSLGQYSQQFNVSSNLLENAIGIHSNSTAQGNSRNSFLGGISANQAYAGTYDFLYGNLLTDEQKATLATQELIGDGQEGNGVWRIKTTQGGQGGFLITGKPDKDIRQQYSVLGDKVLDPRQYASAVQMAANNKMTAAREAALAGNDQEAAALRAEALGMVDKYWSPYWGGETGAIFSWGAGANYEQDSALERLSSPSAKTAGLLVKDATGLVTQDSPQQQQMYRNLTSDADAAITAAETKAERALVAERRSAQRSAMSTGTGYGYRNFSAESALKSSTARDFAAKQADIYDTSGQARAQVFSEARTWMEENTRQFAMDQTSWGQQWLQNQAGFRDSFQARISALSLAAAEMSSQIANRATQAWIAFNTRQENPNQQSGGSSGWASALGSIAGALISGYASSGGGEPTGSTTDPGDTGGTTTTGGGP